MGCSQVRLSAIGFPAENCRHGGKTHVEGDEGPDVQGRNLCERARLLVDRPLELAGITRSILSSRVHGGVSLQFVVVKKEVRPGSLSHGFEGPVDPGVASFRFRQRFEQERSVLVGERDELGERVAVSEFGSLVDLGSVRSNVERRHGSL